MLLLTSS